MEAINLSLSLETVPVTLTDGDKQKKYELREMLASQREKYLDESQGNLELSPDGRTVVRIKKLEGFQASLISKCLFDLESNSLVPVPVIQSWPANVTEQIFTAAQKLNRLEAKEDPEKNG